MSGALTRRSFVTTAAASLGGFAFLDRLPDAGAAGPAARPLARVENDVEPLVRLIEDTPRGGLLEDVVARIHKGTSYEELFAAVFLAGVRGIQPRPVGYKFHAVLVINSAHQATLAAVDQDRWLPLLWSIDNFKASQARNAKEGDWRMAPADESKLPGESQAKKVFLDGMDSWDPDQADRGITAWMRGVGAAEVYEPFWRFGSRDFRDIGHKAIYAANAYRTLQTIGWRHAEPVLRSLAYAQLDHRGPNPSKSDEVADRPGRENMTRVEKMGKASFAGKRDDAATRDVLSTMRTASWSDASKLVAEQIGNGIHPSSIWDGLFLTAGELLMRQPGIVGLHTLTSLNAMHFAFQHAADPKTRLFVLLQAPAFLVLFRQEMVSRGGVADGKLDALAKEDAKGGLDEIFADVSRNKTLAARKTLGLLEREPNQIQPLMRQARRLIFAKGNDSHDYKFSSAVLEDAHHLPAVLRPTFLAAGMFNLRGSGDGDNGLIKRARAALAKA
jgi:hypothetical protein